MSELFDRESKELNDWMDHEDDIFLDDKVSVRQMYVSLIDNLFSLIINL